MHVLYVSESVSPSSLSLKRNPKQSQHSAQDTSYLQMHCQGEHEFIAFATSLEDATDILRAFPEFAANLDMIVLDDLPSGIEADIRPWICLNIVPFSPPLPVYTTLSENSSQRLKMGCSSVIHFDNWRLCRVSWTKTLASNVLAKAA